MDFYSFIKDNAILDIDQLDSLEGQPLWIVLLTSNNNQDYHSVKIPWIHDGIFDQNGIKYNNNFDSDLIYLCRNKHDANEYIAVLDFLVVPNNAPSFTTIFPDEDLADALINSIIITRSKSSPSLDKILNELVAKRAFAIQDRNEYSIFEMMSATNSILTDLIPKK